MSSVMKKLRNKRSKKDEFQITASTASLVLECQKEKWHPYKLAIVWNKENPKLSSTKPVPWQGGFKNPYRGIIVWPEPDPVKTKLTLLKNSKEALYQYQDKPWNILVQNVSPFGKRKVIAVGSLDISDYIQEEPTSHDITVTLKPVKKTVMSGSLEFTLSSVILEDGVPHRTDKEIFDEIMNDAREELERKKSLQKARKRNGQGSKCSASGHKAPVSDTAACYSQALEVLSCSHSSIAGQRKVDSKAPLHPLPLHAASQSAPPEPRPPQPPLLSHLNCEVKEVNSSLSQIETSNTKAAKYPKEFDAFGEKKLADRPSLLKSENASDLCKETSVKDAEVSDRECKNLDQAVGNNNLTKHGDTNIPKNDSRDDDRSTAVPLKKPLIQNEPVLTKAKRHIDPFARKSLKRAKGKKSSKPKEGHHSGICASVVKTSVNSDGGLQEEQEEGDDGHRSTPGQGPSLSDGLSNGETRSIASEGASPFDKETPVQQEQSSPPKIANLDTSALSEPRSITLVEASSKKETPFNQEKLAPDTTDPEASTPSEVVGSGTVVNSAVPEESFVARDIEHQSEDVLPISQHCPELFVYIQEETSLLQDEITSLEKVSTKLEKEIQRANKTEDCDEELKGLTQDWVSINKCRVELIRRKRDLEILGREENLEECISGIRHELMFLFQLEGWRKTDQHKACEQKFIDALLSLGRKQI